MKIQEEIVNSFKYCALDLNCVNFSDKVHQFILKTNSFSKNKIFLTMIDSSKLKPFLFIDLNPIYIIFLLVNKLTSWLTRRERSKLLLIGRNTISR